MPKALETTVLVTGGPVQGVKSDALTVFKSVPFAAPPVGELRWKWPQPVLPWKGVRPANRYAAACPQDAMILSMIGTQVETSEDCLYLNVWTPAKSADERLPILVWIHGGGFAGGYPHFPMTEGAKLAELGFVVVSFQYRVGPWGFLAHPELSRESGKGSGTYGIQDQLAALRWVRDNAEAFGGDSGQVTIFGESAGGVSVSMLAVSPYAKGLFHRAISQSGGSFTPPTPLSDGEAFGRQFLESLGARSLAEARELSIEQIQKASDALGFGPFWPVADGDVVPGDQYELYLAGRFNDTPVLLGTNSDEGAMFPPQGVTPESFERDVRAEYGAHADSVLAVYPHATNGEAAKSTKDVFRDTAFAWNTWAWARLQTRNGAGKAYLYYFDHHGPESPDGATHGAEVPYVFRTLGLPRTPKSTPPERALSELMSSYWLAFARTGDPNGDGRPVWPAFTESEQPALIFDASPRIETLPNLKQLEALERYYAWRRAEAKQ